MKQEVINNNTIGTHVKAILSILKERLGVSKLKKAAVFSGWYLLMSLNYLLTGTTVYYLAKNCLFIGIDETNIGLSFLYYFFIIVVLNMFANLKAKLDKKLDRTDKKDEA